MICSHGIRVVECAVLFNGDTVGMWLGDMGADVIKVESPEQGDYLRDMLGQIVPHHSPAHLQVNKNKRSLTLDLRRDEGRDVFWDLLRTADVFVDGFLAGACDALGIGYERQREVKPDIVYCHCSGFGATGPYARVPTHGQMMNALAASVPLATGDDGLVRERRVDRADGRHHHRRRRHRGRSGPRRAPRRRRAGPPGRAPARGATSTPPAPTASSPRAGSARPTA